MKYRYNDTGIKYRYKDIIDIGIKYRYDRHNRSSYKIQI